MTITVTVLQKGGGRISLLGILLMGIAGVPCLVQQAFADTLVRADTTEAKVILLDRSDVIALRDLPLRGITNQTPALPPQKLSAVLEPPPLPALDTLPITAVDPDLDIVPVHPPTLLPDSLPEPVPAVASYYHTSLAGNLTASGERYDPQDLTAAHRTLPFGTRLRITNMRNGKSVVVRINDRGPFVKGRGIDLSRAAAELLGIVRRGVAQVTIQELDTSL